MRRALFGVVVLASACGGDDEHLVVDAAAVVVDAADIDAATDGAADDAPDALFCDPMLMVGGNDVATESWSVVMQPPATLSYGNTITVLQTTTSAGANTGGQLLLTHPVPAGEPLTLRVELRVEAANPHNQFDAAVAIMGSFTPPFGAGADRSQMIYLDGDRIGWGDDTQSFAIDLLDGELHTVELTVDAAGAAGVHIDETPALTRTGFVRNGMIAIGDQTNDANVDSTIHIRSVSIPCP